jgi:iron complex outermembrane receptor protein
MVIGPRMPRPLTVTTAALVALSARAGAQTSAPDTPAEVVVEGAPLHPQRGRKDASLAATVVRRDRLQAPGLSAVGALRGTPGLVATELGGAGSPGTVSVRGASAAQTPVYLAGVRLNDAVTGSVDLARIPIWFLERIEVYRGNAPIEADRLGMGGAIFLEPRLPGAARLELGALAGSYGTVGAQAISSAGDAADGVVAGVGLGRAQNDYRYRDGRGTLFFTNDDTSEQRERIDASWFDAWMHARRRLGRVQLGLIANHGTLERGAQRNASLSLHKAREETARQLVVFSTRTPFGARDEWFETKSSALLTEAVYRDPARELAVGGTRVEVRGTRVDHALASRVRLGESWLLRPMLALATERLVRREARDGDEPDEPALVAQQLDFRPLLASDLALAGTPLVLRAVLALECSSGSSLAPSFCATAEPTGRVGPTLITGSWVAFANAGRSVRHPALGERFGVSPLLHGNPTLRVEKGLNFDAGLRYDHRGGVPFWLDAVAFVRFARDGIRPLRTAQRYLTPQNVDSQRFLGLELASGVTPVAGVRADVAVTMLDARDTSASRTLRNDVLPFLPRLTFTPSLTLEHAFETAVLDELRWTTRYGYQANRYADRAGAAVLPEQSNVETELDARWFDRRLTTRLRVDNVLDSVGRSDALGAPLPGRSLFVSVEVAH